MKTLNTTYLREIGPWLLVGTRTVASPPVKCPYVDFCGIFDRTELANLLVAAGEFGDYFFASQTPFFKNPFP
jgi:hypothetical protein